MTNMYRGLSSLTYLMAGTRGLYATPGGFLQRTVGKVKLILW